MQRVAFYIDGFNLYYGLTSRGWRRYLWLDQRHLAENLSRNHQILSFIRYFTARVFPEPNDPDKPNRQNTYLEALATLPDVHIHEGYFLPKRGSCARCGSTWTTYEEKMSDVNLAVELLGDAQDNSFDLAIVVSADSDLASPIETVLQRFPTKRVIVAFPPDRHSVKLRQVASAWFPIGRKKIQDSQLPEQVIKPRNGAKEALSEEVIAGRRRHRHGVGRGRHRRCDGTGGDVAPGFRPVLKW